MSFGVTIESEEFKKAIAAMQERAADLTPIALDTALVIQADVDERFNTAPSTTTGGTVYGGETWARLSEAYLQQRPDRAGGQLLRDTGELLQSFTVGGIGNLNESTKNSITFGTTLEKAKKLNPKRPMIFIHDELVENVTTLWESYLLGDFAG